MKFSEKKFLSRLSDNYGRYILFTGLGSLVLVTSLSWQSETAFLVAAGLGIVLELLLEKRLELGRSDLADQIEEDFQSENSIVQTVSIRHKK